ncbi:putative pentatricopeptide repeat-containing protein At3g08820 [Typha angustifolia]|uniref:putative pentatricopeptide repeat-containing protein At3g08820 n=1 Tax=Typha angustifolia TaxID=59011 RepID=UPI003C2B44A1
MLFPALSKLKCFYSSFFFSYSKSYSSCYSSDRRALSFLLQGPLLHPHLLQIHARVFRLGAHQDNLVATRLIGRLPIPLALRVFRLLRNPNVFPFNAAIRVLAEAGLCVQAFSLFKSLKLCSLSANDFTFSFLFKASNAAKDALLVRELHAHVVKSGFELNSMVANGLLLAYRKGAGDVAAARKLFEEMPERKAVCCWTCLISGYAHSGFVEESLMMFMRMVGENIRPEDDTLVGVISACSKLDISEIEKWVKGFVKFGEKLDSLSGDAIDTVLIYLYGKLGRIEESRELFDKMIKSRRSLHVVAWNGIIGGYVQNNKPMEALNLFHQMRVLSSPRPNHVTIVSILSACALVGDLDLGRFAHEYVKSKSSKGIVESNKILATALIDMYSKCGSLEEAKKVFDEMAIKDAVSFNAMIMGLATNGQEGEALNLFIEMEKYEIQPNEGTFLGLLCACTHSGLVNEGRRFFRDMSRKFLLVPNLEHYASFIDLLARAGHIEEALEVVETMPINPNGLVWGALLGACLVHSKVDVAQDIAKRLLDVDPENSAGYVLLSNAYAFDHNWDEIGELRALMKVRGVRKQPGCSWINIDGVVHEFQVGSISHPQIEKLHYLLNSLSPEMRFISR